MNTCTSKSACFLTENMLFLFSIGMTLGKTKNSERADSFLDFFMSCGKNYTYYIYI